MLLQYLVLIICIVVIYKALCSFVILQDGLIGPPLPDIAIEIIIPTAVIESMRQFVPEYRSDGTIIQGPTK